MFGGLVGMSILGGAGLVLGIASLDSCSRSGVASLGAFCAEEVLSFTLVGAAAGAALGALIAAPFKRWKTIYRAESRIALTPGSDQGPGVTATLRF